MLATTSLIRNIIRSALRTVNAHERDVYNNRTTKQNERIINFYDVDANEQTIQSVVTLANNVLLDLGLKPTVRYTHNLRTLNCTPRMQFSIKARAIQPQ